LPAERGWVRLIKGSAVRCTMNFEEVSCLAILTGFCSLCC